MAVAARVVGDAAVAAILAALDMAAESGRAALLDRRHDLELTEAHMPGIGSAPVGSMAMKDVCDLQPWAAHGRQADFGSRPPLDQWCEPVERAGYGPDRRIGDAGVKRRGVELGMAQKRLDHANIDILFEQMRGEAVPQRMWRDALLDPRSLGGGTDGAAELAGGERLDRVAARKQPASPQQQAAPPPLPPPDAQQFEQLRRQHCVTVLAPLAALDAQQHALGIDIADLERDNFGDAQAGAVGGSERRLVLRRCCRAQQEGHFLDAEHRRYPPRIRHDGEPARQIRPVERHREEEAQRRDRAVDARRLHAALRLVQLEETQVFRCRRVGRPADKGRECSDVSHIVAARVLVEAAHGHVFDHARPQWADGPR